MPVLAGVAFAVLGGLIALVMALQKGEQERRARLEATQSTASAPEGGASPAASTSGPRFMDVDLME